MAHPMVTRRENRLTLKGGAYVAILGLFLIALVVSAYLAKAILLPIVLAIAAATIFLPGINRAEQSGWSRWLTVTILAIIIVCLLIAAVFFLSLPFAYWMARASELGVLLREKINLFRQPLSALEEIGKALSGKSTVDHGVLSIDASATSVIGGVFSFVTPAITQSLLFFGTFIFFLIYYRILKSGVVMLFTERDSRLLSLYIASEIEKSMTKYFSTFAMVNVVLGLVVTIIAWLCHLPNPLLWGVLAAAMNFVPYIGPGIMALTLFIVGLMSLPTLAASLIAPALFLGITFIEGHFITPTILGKNLTLNPFAIFLSIAFWAWLWGPAGAFVAVPILIVLQIVSRRIFGESQSGII